MSTQDYINQYLESIGLPADWRDHIDSENYYLGQIILSLIVVSSPRLSSNGKQKELKLASQWLKEMIAKYYPNTEVDLSNINHPKHYTQGKIETIEFLGFLGLTDDMCLGNAIKYLSRYKYKGKPVEDLRKALWYIEYLIK